MSHAKINDCSAAILAGGKNSRYGGFHKAFLRFENELLIQRDLNLLLSIFKEVVIVANQVEIFSSFGVPVYPDIFKERGPLAGIHSALKNISQEAVMIFGCDMPYLDKEQIVNIYTHYKNSHENFCIPRSNGMIEPLHGIYSKSGVDALEDFLNENKYNAIHRFLSGQEVNYLEMDSIKEVFVNINSPEDLEKLR